MLVHGIACVDNPVAAQEAEVESRKAFPGLDSQHKSSERGARTRIVVLAPEIEVAGTHAGARQTRRRACGTCRSSKEQLIAATSIREGVAIGRFAGERRRAIARPSDALSGAAPSRWDMRERVQEPMEVCSGSSTATPERLKSCMPSSGPSQEPIAAAWPDLFRQPFCKMTSSPISPISMLAGERRWAARPQTCLPGFEPADLPREIAAWAR